MAAVLGVVTTAAVARLVLGPASRPSLDPPTTIEDASPPVDLRVEWDGCADVRLWDDAPVCVVDPEQPLRLWIEGLAAERLELVVDGVVVPAERYSVAGEVGEGLRVHVHAEATTLGLRPVGAAAAEVTWALRLGPASSEPPSEALLAARKAIAAAIQARDAPGAQRATTRAHALALAEGHLELAVDMVLEVVFHASKLHLDPEITAGLLRDVEAAALRYPGGRGDLACYRGLYHWYMGENQDAAEQLREAARQARRLEDRELAAESLPIYAEALAQLGYYEDALLRAREAERIVRARERHCELGSVLRTVGWMNLGLQRRGRDHDDPVRFFEEALAIFRKGGQCSRPGKLGGVRLSLALLALDQGRPGDAAAQLERVDRQRLTLDERLQVDDIELRLALARDASPAPPRAAYERLRGSVAAVDTADARWRLHTRHGRLLEREGDAAGAIAAYGAAELELDALVRLQAVGIGRGELADRYHESTEALVSLHVGRGDVGEAWCIVRQDQARRRAAAIASATLDPLRRAELEATIRRYREAKLVTETQEARARDLPLDEAQEVLESAARTREEVRALASELSKTLGRLAPQPRCTELSPPAAGELLLGLYPRERDWLVFAGDAQGTSVHVVAAPRPDAGPEVLAGALLEPVRPQLAGASRVRVLAHRQAQAIDVHRLPWGGEPLGVAVPVSYGVELPVRSETSESRHEHRAFLVADPTNTLAGAEDEVDEVDERLVAAGWSTEVSDRLEPGAVSLAGYELFHYAGHAESAGHAGSGVRLEEGGWPPYPGGEAGWAAFLELGRAGRLTVHDVTTMSSVPRLAVLAGCRTGALELDTGRTSLALAFLVAGSEQVVASADAVEDALGARFARGFYEALVREPKADLVAAMQAAQRGLWAAGQQPPGYRVWVR